RRLHLEALVKSGEDRIAEEVVGVLRPGGGIVAARQVVHIVLEPQASVHSVAAGGARGVEHQATAVDAGFGGADRNGVGRGGGEVGCVPVALSAIAVIVDGRVAAPASLLRFVAELSVGQVVLAQAARRVVGVVLVIDAAAEYAARRLQGALPV